MNAMALPSSLASLIAGLMLASAALAQNRVCDKTYHMQSATQVMLNGAAAAAVTAQTPNALDQSLNGIETLHAEANYRVMTRFEGNGACADYKQTKVDFLSRPKGQASFQAVATSTHYLRLNSTPYPSTFTPGIDSDYWFGFASEMRGDTAVIFETLVKKKGADRPVQWYGTAILTRVVTEPPPLGTPKGTRTHYWPELFYNPDSSKLIEDLLRAWKDVKTNDTQTVSFRVQLIKVVYDSVPPPVSVRAQARAKSAFQASQTGSMVLIRPGDKGLASQALGVYNMMGHQVATLHPTGYLYQWNGRTSGGAEAPTGVYFIQAGSRVLGKFFYSR